MKIDVHNHYYPPRFLDELERYGTSAGISLEKDEWARQVIVQNGNRVVTITKPMNNVEQRLEDMNKAGVDVQVLTLSVPSVDIFPPEIADRLARTINDEIAEICQRHPSRFIGFATLPFVDPEKAADELERCVRDLGFKGACIGSNINGICLDDALLFRFYEAISEKELPVHIHPRAPIDKVTYKDFRLGPMIGFEVDLCVAVVRLIMGGVLDKFPELKFIVSHLGGAIPYLAQRIQNCYEAYPECQANISRPAMEYLKEFYYDTVSFYEPALMCAYSFAGSEHLILGSDYPHVIGNISESISSIEELKITESEKDNIFHRNLERLMAGNG
jgi:aminocarboxymuconate-semialdehyde decarboxylase